MSPWVWVLFAVGVLSLVLAWRAHRVQEQRLRELLGLLKK